MPRCPVAGCKRSPWGSWAICLEYYTLSVSASPAAPIKGNTEGQITLQINSDTAARDSLTTPATASRVTDDNRQTYSAHQREGPLWDFCRKHSTGVHTMVLLIIRKIKRLIVNLRRGRGEGGETGCRAPKRDEEETRQLIVPR